MLVRLALKPPQSSWLQRCYGKDFPLNEERHVHLMTTGLFFTLQKLTTWKGLFTYRENKINRVMIFKRYV